MQEVNGLRRQAREHFPHGSHEIATAVLCKALELVPDSPQLFINRAIFYLAQGDAEAAVRDSF